MNFGVRYSQFLINAEFDNTFFDFPFNNANINDGSFSGSLGGVLKFNDKFHSFINFSSGFRAPNIDDIGKVFESSADGAVVVPNPNLSSEIAYNGEVGFAGLVGEWFYFDFSAYYTHLDNVMSRRDFLFNGQDSIEYNGNLTLVQAIQNLDEAYIYGIQAGVKLHLWDNFELSSKINYQFGEEKDIDGWSPLRHAAPLFGSTRLSWKYQKYHFELNANYNGGLDYDELALSERDKPHLYAKDENGQSFYESWFIINLRTSYAFNDNLSFFIGLDNLFDRRYIAYSSGIVSPGRSINGSIRYSF
jgi:hemoglobin/transferrin/lactoferrin receptor protein